MFPWLVLTQVLEDRRQCFFLVQFLGYYIMSYRFLGKGIIVLSSINVIKDLLENVRVATPTVLLYQSRHVSFEFCTVVTI